MSGEPAITIVGNLVADPELRTTSGGTPVARFRVVSTPRHLDRETNEWRDGDSVFLTCSAWRQAAENVVESLRRGMRVVVVGRLRQRSYLTDKGETATAFEIEVDEVGPSLRSATARVVKNARGRTGTAPAPAAEAVSIPTSIPAARSAHHEQKVPF
jgi:single-strand DNA-binding protein